jgi:peptidoglycan hydrolase-like protein with peptidoglycan-binding domain
VTDIDTNADTNADTGTETILAPVAAVVPSEPPRRRGRRRKRTATAIVLVLALAGGAGVFAERGRIWPAAAPGAGSSGSADNGSATALITVAKRDLAAQTQVAGALGYEGAYTVVGNARGTVTALPAVGQIIKQGQAIYRSDGVPVILLYGSVPAYRDLAQGASGADVKQLNAALVALGYATRSQLDPGSDDYSWQTKAAVEKLQHAMGATEDGILHLGQAVFLPTALRITSVAATLGAPVGGVIAQATSTTRRVTVNLDATEQAQVKVGDPVVITLPGSRTTPGKVSAVGTVATAPANSGADNNNSSPTVEVDIAPTDPAATGSLDQAPVQVSITTASVSSALVVPVAALLALAGGGYAVETVGADGAHKLVGVTLGLFDDADGLVQVTDTSLRPGDRVMVAAT